MAEKRHLFLKILKAEIEYLCGLFADASGENQVKLNRQDIGPIVYQENGALLIQEIESLKLILNDLDSFDVQKFGSIDELAEAIGSHVLELSKKYEFPKSISARIGERMVKIKNYING